jgi:hypothetical protein
MGTAEVSAFLTHLAVNNHVAASTQNVALSALLFLYRHVLLIVLPDLGHSPRPNRPKHLPAVHELGNGRAFAGNAVTPPVAPFAATTVRFMTIGSQTVPG